MPKKDKNEKIETKYLPTKFALIMRILVGIYLLYTSYSLIDGVTNGEGRDKYLFGIFVIVFAVIGVVLLVYAIRNLQSGKYVGGALDAGEDENESVEQSSTDAQESESSGVEQAEADAQRDGNGDKK